MGLLFESLANFENENEKLKYLLEQAQASSKFFGNEYTRLKTENKKLREALEFYAKTESWDAGGVICGDTYAPWGEHGIEIGGKRAVQALKELEDK